MNGENGARSLPEIIKKALPALVIADYERLSRSGRAIEEIRLRSDKRSEFCTNRTSFLGENRICASELQEIFYRLCGNSVYAHASDICSGYIRAGNGIRIGVCGRAAVENGKIRAVHDISSINIRIPCIRFPDVSSLAEEFLSGRGGMLMFSPPGVGKTTVLRSLVRELSGRHKKRIALVDTRSELWPGLVGEELRIDTLEGYPRGVGIEIAVRTMNPQIIVCDEIGSEQEAKAILAARNCGVPIIASAHGDSAIGLISREELAPLHRLGVFERYVCLERHGGCDCTFSILKREEIG